MELKDIRQNIDQIDSDIVDLLRKRIEHAVCAGNLKNEVSDPAREAEVISQVRDRSRGLLSADFMEKIYREIIAEAVRQEHAGHALSGFQGEHGAYSEMAAFAFFKNAVTVPCGQFADVFEGVKNGTYQNGIVPVENTLGGNVTEVDDLLIESGLHVVGEVYYPVHHCLLALPETDYRDVRVVYSHPQALAQCSEFLRRNKLEARQYYNTAGAALMLSRERPAATAVLANSLCAELYQLDILKENVENDPSNRTRFLVISNEPVSVDGNKCTIVFVTKHRPGALYGFLKAFSDSEINLTRIESRPVRKDPESVAFLLDFQGSSSDERIAGVLDNIKANCQTFTLLGCYKEWA